MAGGGINDEDMDPIEEVLSLPIKLSDRIRQSVDESSFFKFECSEVGKQVDRLTQMLRSVVRFSNSSATFYDRPVRRIFNDVSKTLDRALTLVRKCRRRNFFRRVVNIVSAADFRKLFYFLDASIGDMRWLLSVFESAAGGGGGGIVLSLPPIASNDPILAWVWSFIATIHLGQLSDKIEAANELSSVAKDNDRNKKMIAEEGGIPPLLKLLKETTSPEAQIAAATSLSILASNQDRARLIANELGIPIIVQALANSPTRVQISVANLVAKMAENDPIAQEGFARENAIRPLVTILSYNTFTEDLPKGPKSIHSIVRVNKKTERSSLASLNSMSGSSSSSNVWANSRKEREHESPELKLKLKISCAEALWMLARGSVLNSQRITETKGLLCLAKLIETGSGELGMNCLMTIMEITAAAESNADLRRSAFKTNSPAAKAVVDQLLKLIKEIDNPGISIPAIRAIGSLARTFPARQTGVIGPLVEKLNHRNQEVGTEAAIALGKFACSENFLCVEHSKTIIEFDGVVPLMRLLRGNEHAQFHALVLLCYLAIHAGNSEALVRARVLTALEGSDRSVAAQHSELRELVAKAMYHLNMYHSAVLPQRHSQSYSP